MSEQYFCNICSKAFPGPFELNIHERVHSGKASKISSVQEENKLIQEKRLENCDTDQKSSSEENKDLKVLKFECETCKKTFKNNSRLKIHQKSHKTLVKKTENKPKEKPKEPKEKPKENYSMKRIHEKKTTHNILETNKKQKLIKNAIEKDGRQTRNVELKKETKERILNTRGKPSRQSIRRCYVKVINMFISYFEKYKKH